MKRKPDLETPGYDVARTRKILAEAEMAELELAKIHGQLVQTEEVCKAWEEVLRNMKAKLLGMPSKVAPTILGETSVAAIKVLLDNAVEECLNELANYQPTLDAAKTLGGSTKDSGDDLLSEASSEVKRRPVGRPRKTARLAEL
jgi:phage terminase Nu1 subunit (DNA packaging protein)